MKIIILAGGFGTRISEYSKLVPKPMIKIGNKPLLLHVIKNYTKYGYKNFFIATGYKKNIIQNYFKNFKKLDQKFEYKLGKKRIYITLSYTGKKSMTGGRLKRMKKFIKDNENFMFTYGDGVSSVNIKKLEKFHLKKNKIVTVTAVRPPARFGEITIKGNLVSKFKEKSQASSGWINGGFFVANSKIFKFIKSDNTILEKFPLEIASKKKQLQAFKHFGFWKCVDTKRDKDELEKIFKKKGRLV